MKRFKKIKHLPRVELDVIAHNSQRYNTAGDYYNKGKKMLFKVSKTNAEFEFLLFVHEFIEWFLVQRRGVTIKQIDDFDMGEGKDMDDPGTCHKAPYHMEHMFCLMIEKALCRLMDIDWQKYDNYLGKMKYKGK